MKYSIIENGVVVNTAIANAPMAANWRQDDNAGIGWVDVEGVLTAPAAQAPSRKEVILSRLAEIDTTFDKPRTRRELALSKGATKAWLQALDDEAAALRTELAGLP